MRRGQVRWNPEHEEFVQSDEASLLRSRENRAPWNRI